MGIVRRPSRPLPFPNARSLVTAPPRRASFYRPCGRRRARDPNPNPNPTLPNPNPNAVKLPKPKTHGWWRLGLRMQLTGGALLSHRVRLHAYAEEVTMLQRRHPVWRTSGATFNGSGCQRAHTRLENVHVRSSPRVAPLRLSLANQRRACLVRGRRQIPTRAHTPLRRAHTHPRTSDPGLNHYTPTRSVSCVSQRLAR